MSAYTHLVVDYCWGDPLRGDRVRTARTDLDREAVFLSPVTAEVFADRLRDYGLRAVGRRVTTRYVAQLQVRYGLTEPAGLVVEAQGLDAEDILRWARELADRFAKQLGLGEVRT